MLFSFISRQNENHSTFHEFLVLLKIRRPAFVYVFMGCEIFLGKFRPNNLVNPNLNKCDWSRERLRDFFGKSSHQIVSVWSAVFNATREISYEALVDLADDDDATGDGPSVMLTLVLTDGFRPSLLHLNKRSPLPSDQDLVSSDRPKKIPSLEEF